MGAAWSWTPPVPPLWAAEDAGSTAGASNTTRAIGLQQTYCRLNPDEFAGYGEHGWGLTACDSLFVQNSGTDLAFAGITVGMLVADSSE